MEVPYDWAISLLGKSPQILKTHMQAKTGTGMCIVALSTTVKTWKRPNVINGWTDKQHMACPYNRIVFGYERNEILTQATTRMDPDEHVCWVKEARRKGSYIVWSCWHKTPRVGKFTETGSKWGVPKGFSGEGSGVLRGKGFFRGDKNILKWDSAGGCMSLWIS